MKVWVFFIAVAAGLWACNRESAASWRGLPAGKIPRQFSAPLPSAFPYGDYTVKPLATYEVTAVVLGRERYRFDPAAELSPIDLALGWGQMSSAGVINELKISQSGRFYEYSWKCEPPLDPEQIASSSANTHCIPADRAIRSQLLSVKRHEVVTLEGYLVEVSGPNGFTWKSSLTRNDTRGGACELLFVTKVNRKSI